MAIASGRCYYETWALEAGAPAGIPPDAPPGMQGERLGPERTRPPHYVHITVHASRGAPHRVGLVPFVWPRNQPDTMRRLDDAVLSERRTRPVPLGRVTWAGFRGELILVPPLVFGGELGDHLVFHCRDDGVDLAISLHAWAPLAEAVATLEEVVASTT